MRGILVYEFGQYHLVPRADFDIELIHNHAAGTAVGETPSPVGRILLGANRPNPFAAATRIAFRLEEEAGSVDVEVFDVTGARVRTLLSGARLPGGPYVAHWDGTNELGEPVGSGTYFYRLTVDGRSQSKQMVVLR